MYTHDIITGRQHVKFEILSDKKKRVILEHAQFDDVRLYVENPRRSYH